MVFSRKCFYPSTYLPEAMEKEMSCRILLCKMESINYIFLFVHRCYKKETNNLKLIGEEVFD